MKRNIIASVFLCSMIFLFGGELNLTEGLWYISFPENSGEIKPSQIALRLMEGGSAETVLSEKARQQFEEFQQKIKKSTGKEPPILSYSWEWNEGELTIHSQSSQTGFKATDVYVPIDGQHDVLLPKNKAKFTLIARKGARLAPERARQFFKELHEANRDKFADNLKLPENIPLAEPEKERFNTHFFNRSHWRDAPENSFQQFVLNAINKGSRLADDAKCQLPSLEKLLASNKGKAILMQYLACNPEWRVYRGNTNALHAVRLFRYPDGAVASNQFYSHFLTTDENGKKVGDPELEFQFRFEISFDGNAWNSSAMFPRDKTEHRKNDRGGHTWETRFKCGAALVNIFDQSQFEGRQMTAAALEYSEMEFARLLADLENWRALLPKDSCRNGKPDLVLRDGMQGGIYEGLLWCNPMERGTVYLKAFEITKGTQLSSVRLKDSSNCVPGWSSIPQEQFFSIMQFTIYEGEWEQFYGARFEVWFKPDDGSKERKLLEKNYKIQGWQR
ncbi:MAG: hypothetical protein IJS08_14360 [Victivallales bacterium]|nr:hypothetical protein [Victivallales bacterium]